MGQCPFRFGSDAMRAQWLRIPFPSNGTADTAPEGFGVLMAPTPLLLAAFQVGVRSVLMPVQVLLAGASTRAHQQRHSGQGE